WVRGTWQSIVGRGETESARTDLQSAGGNLDLSRPRAVDDRGGGEGTQSILFLSRRSSTPGTSNPVSSPGARLRVALKTERPLQVVGVINALAAMLAEKSGFKALYLSGAGVANASYGVPDVGITTLEDVLIDVRRIMGASRLPLLVDADTGWGDPERAARELSRASAAGMHIEDQAEAKKCGHLAGKRLVSAAVMMRRIVAAVRGRSDPRFVIMARTDAVASEGLEAGIDRCCKYRDAGVDMIFAEALTD